MSWTSVWLNSLIENFPNERKSKNNDGRIEYEHLAPKTNISEEESKSFSEALNYALENEEIHNIAITGSYGSGKSSLISSYIKRQENFDKKFLQISLASFTLEKNAEKNIDSSKNNEDVFNEAQEEVDSDTEDEITHDESLIEEKDINTDEKRTSYIPFSTLQKIEKSILQQMFYRESGFKLPFSRFKRIRNLGVFGNCALTLLVFILFLFPFKFFKEELWIKAKNISLFNSGIKTGILFWLFTACLLISVFFIIRFCNKIKINKLGFQNLDIDLDVKDKNSLLNKYVDEILYYFEVTDYEVVVFEDLDRFKNTEIFIKLRELNTLLNNYKKIKKNRKKITFIYALLDDVFEDNNRTKFFEFIIPIIPVIDYQNSGDYLLERKKINDNTAFSDLDEAFLLDIGLYVNDMRLLKNCINEFKLYDEIINKALYENSKKEIVKPDSTEDENKKKTEPHDRKKIFSLILYKNLYPNDFAKLQNNEGYLYSVFQNESKAIKTEKENLEKEIINLEKSIEEIEKHSDLQIEDLRRRYVYRILQTVNNFYRIRTVDYLSDVAFQKLKAENKITIETEHYYNGYNHRIENVEFSFNFSSIENAIDPNYTYNQKETFIKQNTNGELERLKIKIANCKREIKEINSLSMSDIIEKYNDTSFIPKHEKINFDLVVYLLRNDCIDENYFDYISYFYPESLTRNDNDFIRLLRNHSLPDFEKPLEKFDNILRRINNNDWKNPAILNNSFLTYLLKTNNENLDLFVGTMIDYDNSTDNKFFRQYENTSDEQLHDFYSLVFTKISMYQNWVAKLFDSSNLDEFYKFFILIEVEDNRAYINFIDNNLSFLYRDLSNDEKKIITEKFKKLDVKFELSKECTKFDIFKIIVDNNLYNLTANNLVQIIITVSGEEDKPILNYLTKIRILKNKNVTEYIKKNINEIIKSILLPLGENLNEDEETFISLIKNEDVKIEYKEKLIKYNQVKITDITTLPEVITYEAESEKKELQIWGALIENNKVLSSWNNVLTYFEKMDKASNHLTSFLNYKENIQNLTENFPLSDEEMEDNESEKYQLVKSFYNFIIKSDSLEINSFIDLMTICKFPYPKLENYNIDSKKIRNLIEIKLLTFSIDNYNGIKKSSPDNLPLFISVYFEEILENETIISDTDLIKCFNSRDISISLKNKILSTKISAWNKISDNKFFAEIAEHIIKNNVYEKIVIPFDTIANALKKHSENSQKLIVLLNTQFNNLTNEQIVATLTLCGQPYSELCDKNGTHSTIKLNENELQLCNNLCARDLIASITQHKDEYKIIRKRK
ncbi:hypothetical protein [Treponema sp.]|uniref:YobI family P-loop NTPase n=1 Tax=Treponema sp. TaxID=166 RepID=UPI00388FBEE9